jgi:lipoate-protein ligase A
MTEWRFIDTGRRTASFNMSLDEAIAASVRQEISPPTLRIYGWAEPSVSIGCFQRVGDVDTGYCSENDIKVVRRPTGGRAIFHSHDMTYSFASRTTLGAFSKGLLDSYRQIGTALFLALTKVGMSPELKLRREMRSSSSCQNYSRNPFCFKSLSFGEITINGGKMVGSAQKRWADCLLQQGSIPFLVDADKIVRIFGFSSLQDMEGLMTGLKDAVPELDYEMLKTAVRISFEETFNTSLILSSPSDEELSLAAEFESLKYSSDEWTFKR